MAFNRGWKLVSPDDPSGMPVPGDRVRGKAWRQGRFAKRRHWGSGRREVTDGAEVAARRFKLAEPIRRRSLSDQMTSPRALRAGTWIGYLAMGLLMAMWICGLLCLVAAGLFGDGGFWSGALTVTFAVALVGTQFLGFLSDALTASRCAWGMRALVGFWLSLLVWVPLGAVWAVLAGLLG